jgi:class 3 adenylate cyclase
MCGARLPRLCPRCGFENPPDYRFCGRCGTPLPDESEAEPPAAPAAERPDDATAEPVVSPPRPTTLQPEEMEQAEAVALEGERRVATIILADVQGSTELLEQVGTEAWVEMMNRVFQILESEIYRFGGVIDQFRGDGLVAFFGATAAHEDDPERAVMAALLMQEALEDYAARLAESEGVDLRLRVGVNTGDVVVTSVGDRRRYSEDTAMGEAITIAARMETAAEPGTVLVSENTYRLVSSQFDWRPLGEIRVKGVSHPISVYRPLAPKPAVEEAQLSPDIGLSVPLIDREDEFRTLKAQVEDLYDRRGGIVLISGEKGIGKSFIVTELRHYLARQGALLAEVKEIASDDDGSDTNRRPTRIDTSSPLIWLQGRCRSYDQSWPFAMWQDLLHRWLGVLPGEGQEKVRGRLRCQSEMLWGDQIGDYYPYLADFLSLPVEAAFSEQIKHLDSEERRQQSFRAVREWIEAMTRPGSQTPSERRAGPQPLVIVFSDVHWADSTSLDLLEYCLPLCDNRPVLWLIVFYPDRSAPVWDLRYHVETNYPHRLTNLHIQPLTAEQSSEFIDHLVGAETLPAETRDLIVSKAEGNPYYIQELIRGLIAEGALVRDPESGTWSMTRTVTSLDLPDSLQSVMMARIDRLSSQEREVLQAASVVGSTFWSSVLRAFWEEGEAADALRSHLTALQRAQFIEERGEVPRLGMEYAFRSTLIRDAAYDGLLHAQRSAYHRRVAATIERRFDGQIPAKYNCLLAHHYHEAGDIERQLHYTMRAAEHAQEIYANSEAVRQYSDALHLLDQLEQQASEKAQLRDLRIRRFRVLSQRRAVLDLVGASERARADAQRVLELARHWVDAANLGDRRDLLIDALLQQPGVDAWRSHEELLAGVPKAEKALALARQLEDRHREMRTLMAIANQRIFLDDSRWQEAGEQALALARELGDKRHEAQALVTLGTFYNWTDKPDRGMKYLWQALEITKQLDDKLTEALMLNQLGLESERQGDYHRLLTDYQRKRLELSRQIGYRTGEIESLTLCGQTQALYLGDYEGGLALLREAQRMSESPESDMYTLLRVIQIHAVRGAHEKAWTALEDVRRIDEEGVLATARAGRRLVAAMLHNALGDETDARQVFDLTEEVRSMVAHNPLVTEQYEIAVAHERAKAHLTLARRLNDGDEQQDHLEQALEASLAALGRYEALGYVQIIECVSEEILFCHSHALRTNGQEAEADEVLQRAYDEMMRKHALIPEDSPFRRTYLENVPVHQEIQAAHGQDRVAKAHRHIHARRGSADPGSSPIGGTYRPGE